MVASSNSSMGRRTTQNPILGAVVTKRHFLRTIPQARSSTGKDSVPKAADPHAHSFVPGDWVFSAAKEKHKRYLHSSQKTGAHRFSGDGMTPSAWSDFSGFEYPSVEGAACEEARVLFGVKPAGLSRETVDPSSVDANPSTAFAVLQSGTHTIENNGPDTFSLGESLYVLPPPPEAGKYAEWAKTQKHKKGWTSSNRGQVRKLNHGTVMELEAKIRGPKLTKDNLLRYDDIQSFLAGKLSSHAKFCYYSRYYHAANAFLFAFVAADVGGPRYFDSALSALGLSKTADKPDDNVKEAFVKFYNLLYGGESAENDFNNVDKSLLNGAKDAKDLYASAIFDTARLLEAHHRGDAITDGVPGREMDVYVQK